MTATNPVPLRGRDAELARVQRRLAEVASGVGAVIVIEGRAGLGKTRLLEECAALAASMSFRVGQGVAEPGRSVVDLEALLNALFGGDKPLLARTSLHSLQASAEQTFWLLQDIQSLIEEAALKDRLAICLDDLQWAGPRCAIAMGQLPYRLASLPVAWILAFRPNQGIQPVLDAKNGLLDAGAEFISLGPLDRPAVAELAEDILGAQPDRELLEEGRACAWQSFSADRILSRTAGRRLGGNHDRASNPAHRTGCPNEISDSVHGRLSRMSPAAKHLATLAALSRASLHGPRI